MHHSQFEFVGRYSEGGKDFVAGILHLYDDDLDGADDENLEEFAGELEEIFKRHDDQIGGLLSELLNPEERGTTDGSSVTIGNIDVHSSPAGTLDVCYDVSYYLGCRDANHVDDREESLPFIVDLEARRIKLTLQVPFFENPDPDYEEF